MIAFAGEEFFWFLLVEMEGDFVVGDDVFVPAGWFKMGAFFG